VTAGAPDGHHESNGHKQNKNGSGSGHAP